MEKHVWGYLFAIFVTFWAMTMVADATVGGPGGVKIHENARFDAVCVHEGGTTNDDLCIKDNTVILRKDDVK